jgi:catechol 2,3-dioxygenase
MPAGIDRLPAATRLGPVRLQVADLGRSIAYYEGVLGLRVIERSGASASLGAQDSDATLVELQERPGASPVRRRGHLGLFHFALLLPDRPSLGRLLRHLASIDAKVGASDHLVSEALYLHDPDGLGIEVYADRAPSTWPRQGGELVMATQPLDIEGVIAAGGAEPWTGMPAGTVMGHLHLHVGNLDEAAAFYRDALGLETTLSGYPGALFLAAGGYHHHLGVNTWAGEDAKAAAEHDARLLAWEVRLPDRADVALAGLRLEAAGHTVRRSESGVSVNDPWGTTLFLRG